MDAIFDPESSEMSWIVEENSNFFKLCRVQDYRYRAKERFGCSAKPGPKRVKSFGRFSESDEMKNRMKIRKPNTHSTAVLCLQHVRFLTNDRIRKNIRNMKMFGR